MNLKFQKHDGMSTMGYMIAAVIIFGLIMIISAPFMVDNSDEKKSKEQIPDNNIIDVSGIEQRFEKLEAKINSLQGGNSTSNKYVCTIEGTVNDYGDVVPIDNISGNKKFVFVCEYKY